MNLTDTKYSQYALVREMMDTVEIVRRFDVNRTKPLAEKIKSAGRLLLTGEGSSRLFPAKNAIRKAMTWGLNLAIHTDGSRQSAQYDLGKFAVICTSNSGRTKEVVLLAKKLAGEGNCFRYALTANAETLLEAACTETFVLKCGWEEAVAATKSVVEQALFYQSILYHVAGKDPAPDMAGLAGKLEEALTMPIDPKIVEKSVAAPTNQQPPAEPVV